MKGNHLSLLAVVTVIFVIIAVLLAPQDALQSSRDKALLFPDLGAGINNLGEINIQSQGQGLSLIKRGKQWQIEQADNYPAKFDKIKQTAVAISGLRILAEKTSNPLLYEKLGVEDPLDEKAESWLLSFKDGEKNPLLSIIIGNAHQYKVPGGRPSRYVRLPESEQALLVEGEINISVDASDWFARDLLNISADRIRSVQIQHRDHPEIKIHRDTQESAFTLAPIPAGRTADLAATDRIPALLESIYIDHVKADKDQFAAANVLTTVKTFDGLVARIDSAEIDEKPYIKLHFSYAEPVPTEQDSQDLEESGDTAATAADQADVRSEVEELNKRVSAWLYEIPDYNFALFRKQTEDLLLSEDEK